MQPGALDHTPAVRRKRFWFRLLALTLPVVLVLLVEVGLRIAGYGYPTGFFRSERTSGRTVLTENPRFGWRFFPPKIARAPEPLRFELSKPAGTTRIFVFGESAALGDPEPAYGFGRQVQRLLQARHPDRRFEVINVAMTAINSYVLREIARDCQTREGDVWLIYAGNNEVVGPFGAGTVFGPRAPSQWLVRLALAAKTFRLGQWLAQWGPQGRGPADWAGMEFFVHNQVSWQDPRLTTVYSRFSANLGDMVRLGQRSGAKVIVTTVPVNLRDCPPFASTHRAGLSPAELRAWEDVVAEGGKAETERRYQDALARYDKAAALDSEVAELIFRRARCELAQGQSEKAATDFSLSRDQDNLRFRADSRINQIIVETAAARQAPLVDVRETLQRLAQDHVPGDDQFYDHVHLNFHGNYLVATSLVGRVEQELFGLNLSSSGFLTEKQVAEQLAFTDFDQRRIGEEMSLRLQQPPFSGQSNAAERDGKWREALSASRPQPAEAVRVYGAALAQASGDWVLHANFGRLLETTGDKRAAAEQWRQVTELLPGEPEAYFRLGNLAYEAGSYAEAAERFHEALQWRPYSTEVLNGLGLVLAAEGRTGEALAEFDAALKINPRFSAARVNRAVVLVKSGQADAATAEYETVLRIDTNNVAARINLAKLWFTQGRTNDALALYTRAVELNADNAIGQFDLANALAAQGRHEEALTHYAAAVQAQPDFAEARYQLALELSRAGKVSEALPHFGEAIRLRPAQGELHFNYGVALAKLRRYGEAAQQFEETLKLVPNHSSARSMLNRARQLESGGP